MITTTESMWAYEIVLQNTAMRKDNGHCFRVVLYKKRCDYEIVVLLDLKQTLSFAVSYYGMRLGMHQ